MVNVVDTVDKKRKQATSAAALRHPEKRNNPDSPVLRKPEWIRVKAPGSPAFLKTQEIVRTHNLHTVCEEAACPNIGESLINSKLASQTLVRPVRFNKVLSNGSIFDPSSESGGSSETRISGGAASFELGCAPPAETASSPLSTAVCVLGGALGVGVGSTNAWVLGGWLGVGVGSTNARALAVTAASP